MKPILTILLSFACTMFTSAQKTVLDVFVEAPDSIFPLLTQNDKLDFRDFLNAGRDATVRNKFDYLVKTNSYTPSERLFGLQTSEKSFVDMKLLLEQKGDVTDTIICMCRTYRGPAFDSEVSFYDMHWNKLDRKIQKPALEEFYLPGMPEDTKREFEVLPLICGTMTSTADSIKWQLTTMELSHNAKKAVGKYLQPVVKPLH